MQTRLISDNNNNNNSLDVDNIERTKRRVDRLEEVLRDDLLTEEEIMSFISQSGHLVGEINDNELNRNFFFSGDKLLIDTRYIVVSIC